LDPVFPTVGSRSPMIKSLARRLLRNRRVKRRLPNGVTICVSPDSQLKYLKQEFDLDLTEMCRRFVTEESVVWDIGANCGVMAFNAARAKQIVAVEADPFLADLIQQSSDMNGVDVCVIRAAAFSKHSISKFSIAKKGRASNYLSEMGERNDAGERARMFVPTITLDSLLDYFDPPTFIKIDVEGAEVEVLKGCEKVLTHIRPVLYYESFEDTAEPCAKILRSFDYKITKAAELNWLAEPIPGS
jgi:FkbM family methyltransferase